MVTKSFNAEIKTVPNVTVKEFKLWEGDGMVTLTIPNKGDVYFWYGLDKIPAIESIGGYSTSFECFDTENGEKTRYAYTLPLILTSNSHFAKYFNFQVNSMQDLVFRYDDIIAVLKTFPVNPPTKDFISSGNRRILAKTNPSFEIKPEKNRPVVCDLYLER